MTINLNVTPQGDLEIVADANGREDVAALLNDRGFWSAFFDLLDDHRCNGSFTPFDAGDGNPFVGLTSAPCIAESMDYLDDGRQEIMGRLWWFPNYMLKCPLEELISKGRTVFQLAPPVED